MYLITVEKKIDIKTQLLFYNKILHLNNRILCQTDEGDNRDRISLIVETGSLTRTVLSGTSVAPRNRKRTETKKKDWEARTTQLRLPTPRPQPMTLPKKN